MPDPSTPLVFPQLGALYQMLSPWAEMLLRAGVGLALVPHGLRNTFGLFPSTGVRAHNLTELAKQLDEDGYRPGRYWAPAISVTQLVFGPMLALGLLTRLVAVPIVDLSRRLQLRALARRRVFLEQDRTRIYVDVDLGRILFPGAWRWGDLG